MSEADDQLREMAANRGCKLVKSRRRKPGGDFGRYGLKDAKSGKEILGFGNEGLSATAEEIASFLRSDAVAGWKRSLIAPADAAPAEPKRKRPEALAKEKAAKARLEARPKQAKETPPPRKPRPKRREPEPPRPPKIREARPADSGTITALLDELGYEVKVGEVRKRMAAMRSAGQPVLVAERERRVIGCLSWHVTPVLHRPRPVGRITMLVVAEAERGEGLGSALVAEAEARLRAEGCGLVEVTSNMKRMRAHHFYERAGYERTSYRFAKALQD